jgi:putative spermidine/putrescine transport system permease protein
MVNFGASRWQAILRVTLPEIRPSVVTAAVLAFITSFDELVRRDGRVANDAAQEDVRQYPHGDQPDHCGRIRVLQILIITAALMIAQRFGRGANPMDINGA